MIGPFHDAHTNVTAADLRKNFFGFRAGTDASIPGGIAGLAKNGLEQFFKIEVPKLLAPTNKQLTRPPRTWCNGRVQFSAIGDRIGYLRVLTFSGYTDKGGYAAERQALDSALDMVFAGAAKWRGLIVDVRINFGGSDPLALAIADRLATGEYVAYTKQARADPVDRNKWTPGQPSVVRPSSRPGFRGPVVELIGPLTISAGETFTQALMGRTPKIIRIGEPTQGVFSDVLGRKLPNGWQFGLPNEVFRDATGKTFDGPGIPPDVSVPVLAAADVAAGRDPGLAAALERLNGQ
jgi:C-terminal processing protease CtpA/Prc